MKIYELKKSYHFILENALNKEYNKDEDLYQIALFLNASDIKDLEEISKNDEKLLKAFGKVEEYMSNEEFLVNYDKEEMAEFEKKSFFQDGLKEGHELGKTEERKQIIENMIANGITISEISKMINIEEEEIHKLID